MFRRLLNLFRSNQLEAEIREELEFHRSQTRGSFGNLTLVQEQTRAASTIVWLETFVQDLTYGLRQLRKAPVLSGVAVLSLALGIGANTAIFSLMNAVLLRSLPVSHPEELSLFVKHDRFGNRGNFSYPLAEVLRREAKSFSGTLITSQPVRSRISTRQDGLASARVMIINQVLARQYFARANPVGQYIKFPNDETPTQIVGVVGDSRVQGLRRDPPPIAYTPLAQTRALAFGTPAVMLRLAGKPPDMTQEFKSIHPAIRFETGTLLTQQIHNQLLQERILALLSSFFGALALLLACIGLYGILSYTLARRINEIGVRLALGARPGQVVNMVLRESAVVVILGLAAGIAAALGLSRLVRQFLFGMHPNDPATIIIAVVALSLVAFVAAFLPAHRASRLDPMKTLRTE